MGVQYERQPLVTPGLKTQRDALEQQKEIAEMQFDPGREFLVNLGKGFVNTAGDLTVEAAKWKLFGGEEEQALAEKTQTDLHKMRQDELALSERQYLTKTRAEGHAASAEQVRKNREEALTSAKELVEGAHFDAFSLIGDEDDIAAMYESVNENLVTNVHLTPTQRWDLQKKLWFNLQAASRAKGWGTIEGSELSIGNKKLKLAREPKASRVSVKVINEKQAPSWDVDKARNAALTSWALVDDLNSDMDATPEERASATAMAENKTNLFHAMAGTRDAKIVAEQNQVLAAKGKPQDFKIEGRSGWWDANGKPGRPSRMEIERAGLTGKGAPSPGGATGRSPVGAGGKPVATIMGGKFMQMVQDPRGSIETAPGFLGVRGENAKSNLRKIHAEWMDANEAGDNQKMLSLEHKAGLELNRSADKKSPTDGFNALRTQSAQEAKVSADEAQREDQQRKEKSEADELGLRK
jgi:hypothetical protein